MTFCAWIPDSVLKAMQKHKYTIIRGQTKDTFEVTIIDRNTSFVKVTHKNNEVGEWLPIHSPCSWLHD